MRKKNSLFRFLAVNYLYFTALTLTVMIFFYLGFTVWQRYTVPAADPEELIHRIEKMPEDEISALNVERYLGRGAGIAVFDSDGTRIFDDGGFDAGFSETELIPDFGSGRRFFVARLPQKAENGDWLITEAQYAEEGEPSITGYMFLNEAGERLSGTLFLDRDCFTKAQLEYLRGRKEDGKRIWKYDWTGENREGRRLVFWMQEAGIREYQEAYEAFNVLKWIFIPVYLCCALLCIRWLARRTKKLLDPLNEAILSFPEQTGEKLLETYQGPEEFAKIARNFLKLEKRLQESEEERYRMDREKRRLFADLSHDLKTPVTVISGYARALQDEMVPKQERRRCLEVIAQRSERLGELLQSFHEYSRLEHPQMQADKEKKDLCGIVRDYFAGRYQELELKGYFLKADLLEEPVWCGLDEKLFVRALDNLVNNALKYNPKGTTLFVKVRKSQTAARLWIADDGRGIPENLKETIFSPFVTGDASRGREHGSGLGLSIVREIVRLHGGTVRLEEEPSIGRGTEFVMEFGLWEES